MQVPMWLVCAFKSGEVSLYSGGTRSLQLKVENRKIDVNLMNKELLKDVLMVGVQAKGKSLLKRLTYLNNIAEKLKRRGLTISVSHQGCTLLTLGSGANPTFSQIVTRTNAIEISNLHKLIQLVI